MKELQAILAAVADAKARNEAAILATVVEAMGSTYRRAGARMLLTESGWAAGSISGGCLESDILQKAWWRTEQGIPALVTYDSTAEDDIQWGFGLGCNGVVRVLLERLELSNSEPAHLEFVRHCFESRTSGVVATVYTMDGNNPTRHHGTRLLLNASGTVANHIPDNCLAEQVAHDAQRVLADGHSANRTYSTTEGNSVSVFLEVIQPPLPLIVFGAGHDAVPLVRLGKQQMGWRITVVDQRPAWANMARFPDADAVIVCASEAVIGQIPLDNRTYAVIMTHQYQNDRTLLRALLPAKLAYIGLLGPRRRTERLLGELAEEGFVPTAAEQARLHAPVGLDIGADSPEQIALSIVAEIQAAATGQSGGKLSQRGGSIHQTGPELNPMRETTAHRNDLS